MITTFDQLVQLILNVDKRLDLTELHSDDGLVIGDDLHREIIDCMQSAVGNIVHVVEDDGGYLYVDGDAQYELHYLYCEDQDVSWAVTGVDQLTAG